MSVQWVLNHFSPPGVNAKLTVFMYHRVPLHPDPLFPSQVYATQFEQQMDWVRGWFNVLPLDAAVESLLEGNLPARPAAITFDDGYADNYTVALPILKRLGIPATVFVATDFLDGGAMWNDVVISAVRQSSKGVLELPKLQESALAIGDITQKRAAIDRLLTKMKYLEHAERIEMAHYVREAADCEPPKDLMLTTAQTRALHDAGVTIGAHTASHPILAKVDDLFAEQEIARSRDVLKDITGVPPSLFAYPNGKPERDYALRHANMVKRAGFKAAFSTSPGAAGRSDDLYQLPRFTPWDRTALRWAYRLAQNLRHPKAALAAS